MNMIRPLILSIAVLFAQAVADPPADVVDGISADSLRGHLSFIASDLLEGRDTPSRGLDIAAEYIAAQFRRAGLEAVGDDGYFQTTTFTVRWYRDADFKATLVNGDTRIEINATQASVSGARGPIALTNAPVIKAPLDQPEAIADLEFADGAHPVFLTDVGDRRDLAGDELQDASDTWRAIEAIAEATRPGVIIFIDPATETGTLLQSGEGGWGWREGAEAILTLHGAEIAAFYDALPAGLTSATLSLRLDPPKETAIPVRNVAALLRGSDPELRDTYIIVTAHYDHLGRGPAVDGDDIYNGANDDGSGTVSVIELASALARLPERPRRSILFMCVYGEERGLLGSRYYVNHPLVPLKETIANVNLEHVGRTDDVEGESVARLMPTGFGYSSLVDHFIKTAGQMDVEVYNHPRNSASFFARSDNIAFANAGIPAHTFCTAFIFPDYHGAGDHWDKIDYDNLAKVNRALALGILDLANDSTPPVWNEDQPATGRYVRAWRTLHGVAKGEDRDDE